MSELWDQGLGMKKEVENNQESLEHGSQAPNRVFKI